MKIDLVPHLPLWARRLICRWKGHRRGVKDDANSNATRRAFSCPRCGRPTSYPNKESAAA